VEHPADWIWDLGFGIYRLGNQPTLHPKSEFPNPKSKWLREKDSNLYLLVQSQLSCRLDDPEVNLILDFGFWILD
jgi:hypothetical protein